MQYQNTDEFLELLEVYKAIPDKKYALEIGSLTGETLRYWLDWGTPGMEFVSVDWVVPPSDGRYAEQTHGHEIIWPQWAKDRQIGLTVINADSTKPETVGRVKSIVPYLDFLFIDGGHDYQTVMRDFSNYSPLVRPGGIISFHDVAGIADVKRAWDVIKAGLEFREIVQPGGWGIGVLAQNRRPKSTLTVITPCSRPENLARIRPTLEAGGKFFNVRWMIVVDGKAPPACQAADGLGEIFCHHDPRSVAGKGQINFALDRIQDGWVWVLDDDNVAHRDFFPRLWQMMEAHPHAGAFIFPQKTRTGQRGAAPGMVRETLIDQAQYVVDRKLIGDARFLMKYTADGEFIERLFRRNENAFHFGAETICYHNWLRQNL